MLLKVAELNKLVRGYANIDAQSLTTKERIKSSPAFHLAFSRLRPFKMCSLEKFKNKKAFSVTSKRSYSNFKLKQKEVTVLNCESSEL